MQHATQWDNVLHQIRLDADLDIPTRARTGVSTDEQHEQAYHWQAQVQKALLQAEKGRSKQRWVLGELMRYLQESYSTPADRSPPGAQESEQFKNAYDMLVSVLGARLYPWLLADQEYFQTNYKADMVIHAGKRLLLDVSPPE